jgi:hypothetical protein
MRTHLIFLALVGCTGAADTDVAPPSDETPVESVEIGPDGGSIELDDGTMLEIPAGALSEDVAITATVVEDLEADGYPAAPDFEDSPRYSIVLAPHGLTFDEPVTLRLPHGGTSDGLALFKVDDDSDDTWELVTGLTQDDTYASVEIASFSGYTLVHVPDGSCPCFDPADAAHYATFGAASGWNGRVQVGNYPTAPPHTQRSVFLDYASSSGSAITALEAQFNTPSTHSFCRARVEDWQGGTADVLAADWFPGLAMSGGPSGQEVYQANLTDAQVNACLTILASASTSTLGGPVSATISGMGTNDALDLVDDQQYTHPGLMLGVNNLGLYPIDSETTVRVSAVPVGMNCTFKSTGSKEVSFTATSAGIELEVECASLPTCPCFDLADAEQMLVDLPNATCQTDVVVGTGDPEEQLALSGVVYNHSNNAYDLVGIATDATGSPGFYMCGTGCFDYDGVDANQDGLDDVCVAATRPPLGDGTMVTSSEAADCIALAQAACP